MKEDTSGYICECAGVVCVWRQPQIGGLATPKRASEVKSRFVCRSLPPPPHTHTHKHTPTQESIASPPPLPPRPRRQAAIEARNKIAASYMEVSEETESGSESDMSCESVETPTLEDDEALGADPGVVAGLVSSRCSICTNVMVDCVMLTSCGHSFDRHCVLEWAKQKKACPICKKRFAVKQFMPNFALHGVIQESRDAVKSPICEVHTFANGS